MNLNVFDVLIILVIVILFIIALISIRRNKGKCAYCSHSKSCPFKKVNKDVK